MNLEKWLKTLKSVGPELTDKERSRRDDNKIYRSPTQTALLNLWFALDQAELKFKPIVDARGAEWRPIVDNGMYDEYSDKPFWLRYGLEGFISVQRNYHPQLPL